MTTQSSSLRVDLRQCDGREVTEYLQGLGWSDVTTNREDHIDALLVEAAGDRDLEADLDGFRPTAPIGEYRPMPEAVRTHAGHLKAFRDAVRAGQAPTLAQTQHVLADVIDWLRLQEERL